MGLAQQQPSHDTACNGVAPLTTDTIPAVLDLIRDQPAQEFFLSPPDPRLSVRRLKHCMTHTRAFVLGTYVEDQLAGFSIGYRDTVRARHGRPQGVIHCLFVRKEYRGQDNGPELLEKTLQTLLSRKCFTIIARLHSNSSDDIPESTFDVCSQFRLHAPLKEEFSGELIRMS